MRHLFGILCACALTGVPMLGCSDDGGAGGNGGNAGSGGGGTGGVGGNDLCADVDCNDGNSCTSDACDPADGSCSHDALDDGTSCLVVVDPGECVSGACVALCDLVDCSDDNECTEDLCNSADGTCDNPNRADGSACDFGGLPGVCSAGACEDAGLCVEVDCSDGNECTEDACNPADGSCSNPNRADGSRCDDGNGTCSEGSCAVRKIVTVGCTNNVTDRISILDWELEITHQGDIGGGETFDVTLDGIAYFSEEFLDNAQAAIPGGVAKAAIFDLAGTVLVRSGGTGAPVTLGPIEVPYSCFLDGASCDPEKSDPVTFQNPDCQPAGTFNPCLRYVPLPTSSDCDECDALGPPKDQQCEMNGFCITTPLPMEMEAQTTTYTAGASGEMLIGWDDQNTGATVNEDGTYDLPPAIFAEPVEPNGVRVLAILQAAVQCTMAVDSDGPDGVGVPDAASPTPDSALLSLPIQ